MNDKERVGLFLKAIEAIFSGMDPKTFWPLNGGQIDAYFDVVEALDMYDLLTGLRRTHSIEEIAMLMPAPDILRLFLEHNAIIGLKVAKKLGIRQISTDERVAYLGLLLEILACKVKGDIFCLDGKNLLLDAEEVKERVSAPNWDNADVQAQKDIASLIVHTNNVCYSLYYDIFMAGGFYLHGPYHAQGHFGRDTCLVVREYHNLSPKELWPGTHFYCRTLRIEGMYRHLDLKINFANHPISTTSIGDKLVAYRVFVDGKKASDADLKGLIDHAIVLTSQQTKHINALPDLDKVRKGAEIAFYLFKDFRVACGREWRAPAAIEHTITHFGDRFIKQFAYVEKPSLEHWKRLFDPRDDYY